MGVNASLGALVVGAILTFGVNLRTPGVSLDTIGIILMIVGTIGLVVSSIIYEPRRRRLDERIVVEERNIPAGHVFYDADSMPHGRIVQDQPQPPHEH
jgi:hypothetical protein